MLSCRERPAFWQSVLLKNNTIPSEIVVTLAPFFLLQVLLSRWFQSFFQFLTAGSSKTILIFKLQSNLTIVDLSGNIIFFLSELVLFECTGVSSFLMFLYKNRDTTWEWWKYLAALIRVSTNSAQSMLAFSHVMWCGSSATSRPLVWRACARWWSKDR